MRGRGGGAVSRGEDGRGGGGGAVGDGRAAARDAGGARARGGEAPGRGGGGGPLRRATAVPSTGGHAGPVPRRPAALRLPAGGRRPSSEPGEGRPGSSAAPPGARPHERAGRPAHLRGVPRRSRLLRHRRAADRRWRPLAVGSRPCPQQAPVRVGVGEVGRAGHPAQSALHRLPGLGQTAARRGPPRRGGRQCWPPEPSALEWVRRLDLVRRAGP